MSLLEIHTDHQRDSRNIKIVGEEPQGDAAEDDLGLPAPSIELLDKPPPVLRAADTTKRGREPSPNRHRETSCPPSNLPHLMSINQRTEYENRQSGGRTSWKATEPRDRTTVIIPAGPRAS